MRSKHEIYFHIMASGVVLLMVAGYTRKGFWIFTAIIMVATSGGALWGVLDNRNGQSERSEAQQESQVHVDRLEYTSIEQLAHGAPVLVVAKVVGDPVDVTWRYPFALDNASGVEASFRMQNLVVESVLAGDIAAGEAIWIAVPVSATGYGADGPEHLPPVEEPPAHLLPDTAYLLVTQWSEVPATDVAQWGSRVLAPIGGPWLGLVAGDTFEMIVSQGFLERHGEDVANSLSGSLAELATRAASPDPEVEPTLKPQEDPLHVRSVALEQLQLSLPDLPTQDAVMTRAAELGLEDAWREDVEFCGLSEAVINASAEAQRLDVRVQLVCTAP